MKLELNGNRLSLGDKEIKLTDEQLKELGIRLNPFEVEEGERCYYINKNGNLDYRGFASSFGEDINCLKRGKYCKDKKLIEQKRLHQNLNDLLWKFTIENGWSEELWEDNDIKKWSIELREDFSTHWIYRYKSQGTIYFISEEIAQKAIDEIVKPYMEEHPEFVW